MPTKVGFFVGGEENIEVTLCLTEKHHAEGDIAGWRQSSMPRGIYIAEQRWRFEGSFLPYKVDQRVKHTLNCSYRAQGFLGGDTAIDVPLPDVIERKPRQGVFEGLHSS